MLDEGPRDAAGVLRFPRGALGSLAHDEPHRKRLRDRQAQNGADERLAIINNCQADGVQAAQRRIKDLAAVERNKSVAKGHWRCQIPRWHRGHRSAGKLRRLIASSPKIPHSSIVASLCFSQAGSATAAGCILVYGWRNGVHENPMLSTFNCKNAHQSNYCALGRSVGGLAT